MTYQEKKAILSIISTVLIFGSYSFYVFVINEQESLSQISEPSFWGKFILISIPVSIVANIIITIVFTIVNKMATNEDMPSFSDELDKLIELKSERVAHIVFIFGFLTAMITQVMDKPLYVMFIVLISAGFISSILDAAAQLYYYRRGI